MPTPRVFDYHDFRTYLSDWFQYRKAKNPRFSHRAVARRMGSTDPSVLSNVMAGRRNLTEDRIATLTTVLGLDDAEGAYFAQLVAFGQAPTPEEKQRCWAGLVRERLEHEGPSLIGDRLRYMSCWFYSAVHTLAECHDFRPDPSWIADRLRPRITEDEATEALKLLSRLGYLVPDGDRSVPQDPVLRTSQVVDDLATYGYHRDMNRIAGTVLEGLLEPKVARETGFLGFTISVEESKIAELRALIWKELLGVAYQANEWTGPRERVVQVNIQMFPVSAGNDPPSE